MGNLCFPKRQRVRLPAFVCLFVEDTFDFRAKWNHKSENWKHKTETREESEKSWKITITIDSANRPYYLILISHLFHTTRHRHLVDDFTARLEGPTYQGAPPRTRTADPPHPMHNATSASDGSPPPSSVIRLWSSVFGLLSGRHANWQLPCECANAATLRQPTTQPARHDATRWAPSPLYDSPLSPVPWHYPLPLGRWV